MSTTAYIISGIITILLIAILFSIRKRRNSIRTNTILDRPIIRNRRTEYYEDGRAVKFLYECVGNDKDGKEELYYPSGKLNRVRNWKRGALDGEMIVYHSNGNVYIRGNYKNGSLVGEYTVFKDNGDLLTIKQY
jgi:antitoxin component YwqK of YwqJK toxin-antitoxin module